MGDVTQPTHNQMLLAILADRDWHSTRSIIQQTGGIMVHSRAADLRARGFEIETRRVPGARGAAAYEYRLVDSALPGAADLPISPSAAPESAGLDASGPSGGPRSLSLLTRPEVSGSRASGCVSSGDLSPSPQDGAGSAAQLELLPADRKPVWA